MLLAEYPWLLSQGMKASVRKNIVGSRDGAGPVSTRAVMSDFIAIHVEMKMT